jgi:hypothetical protein
MKNTKAWLAAAALMGAGAACGSGGKTASGAAGGSSGGSTGASTSAGGSTTTSSAMSTSSGASSSGASSGGMSTSSGASSSSGTCGSGSSTSGGVPAIVRSFDGDTGPGLAACTASPPHCGLPEMNVASSGTQVVQITWQNVTVFDACGNVLQTTPLTTLITSAAGGLSPGNHPIEPHVVYDEFIQRWIITTTCLNDCLLVSATSDARGSWAGIYLDGDGNDPALHLGYDKNGVYVEEGQMGTNPIASQGGYAGTLFAIPSAEVAWTGTFNPAHRNRAPNRPLDGMPAIDQNPNKPPTAPAFFLTKSCNGSCQNATNFSYQWVVTPVTWSGTTATYGSDQIVHTGVGSTQDEWLYNTPIAAVSQPMTAVQIRPIEAHRVLNVAQDGAHLYSALGSGPCTSGCGTQGTDANNLFFWVDLDCTNPTTCTVTQTGKVSDPAKHYAFATTGVASNGNVGIVAAAIGPNIFPSIAAWSHPSGSPLGTLSGPVSVVDGTAPDACTASPLIFANAVGIHTVRDPVDPTKLWTTHQYGGSTAACVWKTRIVELSP